VKVEEKKRGMHVGRGHVVYVPEENIQIIFLGLVTFVFI
jgi:hypothetical protein